MPAGDIGLFTAVPPLRLGIPRSRWELLGSAILAVSFLGARVVVLLSFGNRDFSREETLRCFETFLYGDPSVS